VARRKGAEFNDKTKETAWKKYGGKDAITGEDLGNKVEYDHILPVAWARDNAPDIGVEQLRSADNCRPVNQSTHKERHRNFDEDEAWFMVTFFRAIQKRLFE
jgi:hypothetical protein